MKGMKSLESYQECQRGSHFSSYKKQLTNSDTSLGKEGLGLFSRGNMVKKELWLNVWITLVRVGREFLAEVQTIGSIHHIYLVRVIGLVFVQRNHIGFWFMSICPKGPWTN